MSLKIVIVDGYALNPGDLNWQQLEKLGEVQVYERTAPQQLIQRVSEAEIVITNKVVFNASIMQQLPKLKYIAVTATGYNNIDVAAAKKAGIVVSNVPAYSTDSVAQMVFSYILAFTNGVETYNKDVHASRWVSSKDFTFFSQPLIELTGKVIGIYGYGAIGSKVAQIALAFGMKPIIFTRSKHTELPAGIQQVGIEDFWKESDFISLHAPLTEQTKQVINKQSLSLMKKSALLINTGRGPLVDEAALADALKRGEIAAAAVDVLSTEPPAKENPLLTAPNCTITPHVAWASKEARERLLKVVVQNIKSWLEKTPQNRIV